MGQLATIPSYLEEIKENKEDVKSRKSARVCFWGCNGNGPWNEWCNS